MKKHPNKTLNSILILVAIFSTLVFTGVESFALNNEIPTATSTTSTQKQMTPSKNVTEPTTIPGKNAYALTHMEKTGFKYGLFKFFMAMVGVLISALAIFLGLKFYKDFILKNSAKLDNIDYDKTLESPRDFRDAINIFLDKTDK